MPIPATLKHLHFVAVSFLVAVSASVKELEQTDFLTMAYDSDLALVEFYAPWCEVCKQIEPELARVAKVLAGGPNPVPVGRLDADEHKMIRSRYKVKNYPDLRIFKKGKDYAYRGQHQHWDAVTIIQYMQLLQDAEAAGPVSSEIKSFAEIQRVGGEVLRTKAPSNGVVIVGCFTGEHDPAYAMFLDMGQELRGSGLGFRLVHSFSEEVRQGAELTLGELGVLVVPELQLQSSQDRTVLNLNALLETHRGAIPMLNEPVNTFRKDGEAINEIELLQRENLRAHYLEVASRRAMVEAAKFVEAHARPLVGLMTAHNTPFSPYGLFHFPLAVLFTEVRRSSLHLPGSRCGY
jgi:thiol-disulfide isomerase/thioredoxin